MKILYLLPILFCMCVLYGDESELASSSAGDSETLELSAESAVNSGSDAMVCEFRKSSVIVDDGFEPVPRRAFYGPLGLIFKLVEHTLDRLYILFDW